MGESNSKEQEVNKPVFLEDQDHNKPTQFNSEVRVSQARGKWIVEDANSNRHSDQSHTSPVNSRYSAKSSAGRENRKVRLLMPNGNFELVSFCLDECLTVGWLHSEYFRILISTGQNTKGKRKVDLHQVRLCTVKTEINIDFLLSDYSETLDFLPDSIELKQFDTYEKNGSLQMKDMTIIKRIGEGGFSKVFLIRRNDNGQFYALKICKKKDLNRTAKEEYAFNEKKLLTKLSHQFINKFVFSFQTQNHLCFGLDYCSGGSLYNLQQRFESFPEEVVRAAIAQVAISLDYLHRKGVIYRDLKVARVHLGRKYSGRQKRKRSHVRLRLEQEGCRHQPAERDFLWLARLPLARSRPQARLQLHARHLLAGSPHLRAAPRLHPLFRARDQRDLPADPH